MREKRAQRNATKLDCDLRYFVVARPRTTKKASRDKVRLSSPCIQAATLERFIAISPYGAHSQDTRLLWHAWIPAILRQVSSL